MTALDDVTVVILAGGRGARLKELGAEIPKPMIPVAGKPFLNWLTLWLSLHGLRHYVYSAGYRGEQIEAWVGDSSLPGLERVCRREETPLGTGGGLLNCIDLCREWVLVVNGDGLIMEGIGELLALRQKDQVDGGLIGVQVEDKSRYGSLSMNMAGRLIGFREKMPGQGLINGGIYLFRTSRLAALTGNRARSIEYDIFPELIGNGVDLRVIEVFNAPFIDIGTPQTLAEAEDFVAKHLAWRI